MSHTGLDRARITLDRVCERHVASVRTTTHPHRLRHTIDSLHELVMCVVGEQGLAPAGPLFTRYHDLDGTLSIEAGMPLAQPIFPAGVVLPSILPGGPVLRCRYFGNVDGLAAVRDVLARYQRIQGVGPAGPPWESYLVDRRDVLDEADSITEVYLPVILVCSRRPRTNRPARPGRSALRAAQAIR